MTNLIKQMFGEVTKHGDSKYCKRNNILKAIIFWEYPNKHKIIFHSFQPNNWITVKLKT